MPPPVVVNLAPAALRLSPRRLTPVPPVSLRRRSRVAATITTMSSQQQHRSGAPPPQPVVPGLSPEEIASAAGSAFLRHSSSSSQPMPARRGGGGVAIVWFRNDLRILDNEALMTAWSCSSALLPVYCVDPRCFFGTTHYFGFPKTGALRAKFLMECLSDLKKSLIKRGLNLLIQNGKPEDVLPSLAKQFGAHTVFAHKETCSEELLVEKLVIKGLQQVVMNNSSPNLQLVWGGATMYHVDDLPFTPQSIPDVYTQFRKSVESKCSVRSCCKLPVALGPLPRREMEEFGGWVTVPSLEDLGRADKDVRKLCYGFQLTGFSN